MTTRPKPPEAPQSKTTRAMMWVGFLSVIVKYVCADMTILGHTFNPFDEGAALTVMGPLAVLYAFGNRIWQILDRDGDGKLDLDAQTLDHLAKLAQKTGHPLAVSLGKMVDNAIDDAPKALTPPPSTVKPSTAPPAPSPDPNPTPEPSEPRNTPSVPSEPSNESKGSKTATGKVSRG